MAKKREYVIVKKDGTRDLKIKSHVSVPFANSALGYPLLRTCLECKELVFAVRGNEWGSLDYSCPDCGYKTHMAPTLRMTVLSSCTTEESAQTINYFELICKLSLTKAFPFAIMYI
jgi:DNA-directed RNA polymerase subunit RPC12/RpoP